MALSQIQCMDNEHINPRINESKAEFLYSEEQRVALEKLFQDGPAAYEAHLKAQGMRGFLSEHELEYLTRTVTVYNPGAITGHAQINGAVEDSRVPSEYWPDRSDHSLSELELGWPDITSYRGVTRATVYAHPPIDGQPHIKELVRKTITQAQKVIGIAMDLFTDVDIFKDLLDMSYRRRVAVYILLDAAGVPHFLHMCQRAGMHKGHLKNLRVTCTRGSEFYTRSSKKVCGVLSQKFMFVDGDKSVSGSYSYTWTASRLDRSVVTMVTGQAVETFDRLFRDLYFTSRAVNLSDIKLEEEPEVEPIHHTIQNPQVAAALARKMYSAKYALVSNSSLKSNGTYSGRNSSGNANPLPKLFRLPRQLEEPKIHPWLVDMQRANMMNYLPTWPEPDPPSDVIGIINIRDTSKPFQAHLMRSELFETSQAIRFKEPLHVPEEPLPDEAIPRTRLELADVLWSAQPLKTKGS
ncbi:protein FAM83G isoform X2 [Sardina pilchardus]|uniref:protein FAM83G isoform X2 n=1 Tax=Sardina pilchardus TaxID=27697 RepID=UPI002E0D69A0